MYPLIFFPEEDFVVRNSWCYFYLDAKKRTEIARMVCKYQITRLRDSLTVTFDSMEYRSNLHLQPFIFDRKVMWVSKPWSSEEFLCPPPLLKMRSRLVVGPTTAFFYLVYEYKGRERWDWKMKEAICGHLPCSLIEERRNRAVSVLGTVQDKKFRYYEVEGRERKKI